MSDTPQGPGWWQASDDKWYPPPRPAMPGEEAAPSPGAPAPTAPAPGPTAQPPGMAPPGAPAPGPFGPPPGAPGAPPGVPSGGYPAGPPTAPVPGPPMAPMPGASGPYGAMPPGMPPGGPGGPGGPPPGDSNRTPLFVVLGVLGAAAVVLLIFLLAGGDDEDDATGPDDPPVTTEPSDPDPTSPPDTDDTDDPDPAEGDVVVVDEGFSNFEDGFGEAAASFGFIVENTGDDILQSVESQVVIYGADDRVITTKDFTVGTIRPGEKMGFGDEMYGEDLQAGIERLEIQVRDHSDSAANPADIPDGGFEVANVDVTSDDYNMTITFDLTSTYTVDDVGYPSTYVLFRDADDKIIGAAWGAASFETEPQAQVEVTTYDVIPNVETTEVYVDPGYVYAP